MKVSSPNLLDRQALLDRAVSSGLFTSSQRTKAEGILPPEASSAIRAAQLLVQAGLLTRFQAERLVAGKTDGFVIGQYVIEEHAGRGAGGRVYRAKHRTMNRAVALKVLSPELTRNPQARQAFHDGVRAAAKLIHPNIVTTYDANEVGDRFYVVLEYVDGPSAQTLVEERGPIPCGEACEIIRQAALGLKHAHDQGMTHCNLKPGNLLISRNPRGPGALVKLTDFGLAALSPARRRAPLEQTPLPLTLANPSPYVAPSKISSSDPRVDLYSLGGIFHLLLTGAPPPADGVLTLPPQVPTALADVVRLLLSIDSRHPIASTTELLQRLDGFSQTVHFPQADRGAVNFEIPTPASRTDSMSAGYLTGIPEPEASPWAEIVAPFYESGPETLDPASATRVSLPALRETSPRSARMEKRPPPPRSSVAMLVVIAISMCMLSLCAIAVVIRYMGK